MSNERASLTLISWIIFGEHCNMILLWWPWKHHFWAITIPLNQPIKYHVPVNMNVVVTLSAEEIYCSVTQSFQGTPDTEHPLQPTGCLYFPAWRSPQTGCREGIPDLFNRLQIPCSVYGILCCLTVSKSKTYSNLTWLAKGQELARVSDRS